MLGFLNFIFSTGGLFFDAARISSQTEINREIAINEHRDYYFDGKGIMRHPITNHKVIRSCRNGDLVLVDLTTEEIIINYSNEKRLEMENKIDEYIKANNTSKQKSINDGMFSYVYYDPEIQATGKLASPKILSVYDDTEVNVFNGFMFSKNGIFLGWSCKRETATISESEISEYNSWVQYNLANFQKQSIENANGVMIKIEREEI